MFHCLVCFQLLELLHSIEPSINQKSKDQFLFFSSKKKNRKQYCDTPDILNKFYQSKKRKRRKDNKVNLSVDEGGGWLGIAKGKKETK